MPEASPFWQNAFVAGVFVVLAWGAWSGWRAGVVRTGFTLGGLIAGGFVGTAVGSVAGSLFGALLPLPGMLIGLVAGCIAGAGVYFAAWVLGALLFKRTAQQRTAVLRFFFGGGGAVLGVFFSVTLIWGILFFVRGLGGFYEARFSDAAKKYAPPPNAATAALVKLKRSIEAGGTGRRLLSIDVMPQRVYRIMEKFGRVAARPDAMVRFFEYPGIADLVRDPKVAAITMDPDANDAARAQNIALLLKNQKFVAAANDPALIAKLQKIDIEAALDFALSAPESQQPPPPHSLPPP